MMQLSTIGAAAHQGCTFYSSQNSQGLNYHCNSWSAHTWHVSTVRSCCTPATAAAAATTDLLRPWLHATAQGIICRAARLPSLEHAAANHSCAAACNTAGRCCTSCSDGPAAAARRFRRLSGAGSGNPVGMQWHHDDPVPDSAVQVSPVLRRRQTNRLPCCGKAGTVFWRTCYAGR